jgi:hypothetical protein
MSDEAELHSFPSNRAQDVIDETGKRGAASRLAGERTCRATVMIFGVCSPSRWSASKLFAQRDEEILGLTTAQATREARVVVVERVRDDEMWPAVIVGPIG